MEKVFVTPGNDQSIVREITVSFHAKTFIISLEYRRDLRPSELNLSLLSTNVP